MTKKELQLKKAYEKADKALENLFWIDIKTNEKFKSRKLYK